MYTKIITPPEQVIDLARAKLQCKITGSDRDPDVADAIAAARDYAQREIGLPIGEQTVEFTYPTWCGSVELPCDVTSLLSVSAAGADVSPLPSLVGRRLTLAAAAPVVVTITCGWTAATLPATVKAAMLLLIADLVRNPQAQSETQLYKNETFNGLMWMYRERLPL
ncbi:hypothetical protein RD110_18650 [Rhodoferax koreense]|uniref:Phage gp6-like head-tail connector protein n=1 Tax=Rhodoferax koreensis TaxID=1842727 RepID=A0A1P8JZ09_9BURK|nr:head-tail connector protein [Rhodoferax koreense]APW38975.1 hypothetical protein RD110_18650 [Rhodoferax koreense]